MDEGIKKYCSHEYRKNQFDVNFDEVMELVDAGYGFDEIAKELSVSKEQMNMFQNQINKYY
ncbi:MAG: hypothetical protein N4A68_06775 [Maledivibacter sp.]|jgi:predicted nucleotidyltransferase|nr:hypothetical protein [Maledivibacter sp.]